MICVETIEIRAKSGREPIARAVPRGPKKVANGPPVIPILQKCDAAAVTKPEAGHVKRVGGSVRAPAA